MIETHVDKTHAAVQCLKLAHVRRHTCTNCTNYKHVHLFIKSTRVYNNRAECLRIDRTSALHRGVYHMLRSKSRSILTKQYSSICACRRLIAHFLCDRHIVWFRRYYVRHYRGDTSALLGHRY